MSARRLARYAGTSSAAATEGPDFRLLYAQVRELMVRRIAGGAWRPGDLLPSEFRLAAELGVSQGTVRKALDELAAENLVVRRQGRGTFVAAHDAQRELFRFFRLADADGRRPTPTSRQLSVRRERADAEARGSRARRGRAGDPRRARPRPRRPPRRVALEPLRHAGLRVHERAGLIGSDRLLERMSAGGGASARDAERTKAPMAVSPLRSATAALAAPTASLIFFGLVFRRSRRIVVFMPIRWGLVSEVSKQLRRLAAGASVSSPEGPAGETGMKITWFAWLLAFASLPIAGLAQAAPIGPAGVLPPGSTVAGRTIGEWSAEWWRWAFSHSGPDNPLADPTGANAGENQSGPVFFFAGTTGGEATRSFPVPAGRFLLVPLVNVAASELTDPPAETEEELRAITGGIIDAVDSLTFSLNGVPLFDPFAHREASPVFDFTALPGNPFGVPAGPSGTAVADGYYVMLDPLPVGTHVIEFGGGILAFDFATRVRDEVTVVPVPPTMWMVGSGVLALVSLALARRGRPLG
jgi:DNA-binding transcriptional regulator YhcF (GntR family)